MDQDADYLADVPFFELVELGGLPPQGTLAAGSGLKADPGPYATNLVERVARAWRTPYRDLTCEQVRTLVAQKAGLEWLSEPILRFARRYPAAAISNYPGEMGLLSLRAAKEFLEFAPASFRDWLCGDFSWMDEAFGWSRQLREDAGKALSSACDLAGAGSLAVAPESSHMRRGSRADGALANPVRSGRKQP